VTPGLFRAHRTFVSGESGAHTQVSDLARPVCRYF
jgi:hypothetical protein